MKVSQRYLLSPRADASTDTIDGVDPVLVWDFDSGTPPQGFSLTRSGTAYGIGADGTMQAAAADTLRFDQRTSNAAILEPQATNLVSHSHARKANGWSENGATAGDLDLDALGVFSGCEVRSNGALWHRLNHTAQPAVSQGQAYGLQAWVQWGSAEQALITLRNMAAGVESRVELSAQSASVLGSGAGAITSPYVQSWGAGEVVRLSFEFVPNFDGQISIGIGPGSGTWGDTIVVLGLQMEAGVLVTSYIETDGGQESRSADEVSWPLPSGRFDLRIVTVGGALLDQKSIDIAGAWVPSQAISARRLLAYPEGTL